MGADDPVQLLPPDPESGLGLRQGVVVEWNPATAENKVLVGGTIAENLPILNTNEAIQLTPGAVVAVITNGSTWFVLGRITIPGTPEAASVLSMITTGVAFEGSSALLASTYPSYVEAPDGRGPHVTVRIGPSRRALVIVSSMIQYVYGTGAAPPRYRNGRVGYRITQLSTGTVTLPPSDDRQLLMQTEGEENTLFSASLVTVAEDHMLPAPGDYRFELMYAALNLGGVDAAGQMAFSARLLAVIPL
ncbi:hypothetical protein C1I95_21725 [Micromonospora craterilacus]|uniref:Uncharacterized protein n=1 Tax=Micromonospora craterilacus TaxID=1655439 RepID=A0A2W2EBG6_9ACTN|nr:hypothetical protein [Micromonospora craterilacus]PZG14415.1 hypothetical protein C1I95_21725 [Micromonospora craterilacus]